MTYLSKYVKAIDYTSCHSELAHIKERHRWRTEAAFAMQDSHMVIDLIAQVSQKEASQYYLADVEYLLQYMERGKNNV